MASLYQKLGENSGTASSRVSYSDFSVDSVRFSGAALFDADLRTEEVNMLLRQDFSKNGFENADEQWSGIDEDINVVYDCRLQVKYKDIYTCTCVSRGAVSTAVSSSEA